MYLKILYLLIMCVSIIKFTCKSFLFSTIFLVTYWLWVFLLVLILEYSGVSILGYLVNYYLSKHPALGNAPTSPRLKEEF